MESHRAYILDSYVHIRSCVHDPCHQSTSDFNMLLERLVKRHCVLRSFESRCQPVGQKFSYVKGQTSHINYKHKNNNLIYNIVGVSSIGFKMEPY